MIKPNLISSHDWHVQPICQRSLRVSAWAGPLGSRPGPLSQGVLELVCAHQLTHPIASKPMQIFALAGVFARTFQKYRTLLSMSSLNVDSLEAAQPAVGGCSSIGVPKNLIRNLRAWKAHAAQNIKERPAKYARAARARGRSTPGSCNGLFSAGFPTGVQGRLPHLTQRTSFPLPSTGQATRPPGGSTAQSATSKE